jgi:hypothetical protein
MKTSSSCPKYDIPSCVFKIYKDQLWIPLKLFFTLSFNSGQIPNQYKTQSIIPIHKKGPKTIPENFRPVTITPHTIKIGERIIRKTLMSYLEANNFLSENQHGFRNNRSCSTQLIEYTTNVFDSLVKGDEVDAIYLDYSKAFDKVDHTVLLMKLKSLHLGDKYLKWLECFLRGRTQTVIVDNQSSYSTPVISGVPQGSVLGPLLFNIYINDLPLSLTSCRVLTFADDTKLISNITSSKDTISLQENLAKVSIWSDLNNMSLNANKFELLQFKPNQNNKSLSLLGNLPFSEKYFHYQLPNDTIIEPSNYVKDLGIFIACDLEWDIHYFNICNKARRTAGWVLNTFVTRDPTTMITLFTSLIRPILEYNCEIWNPYKIKDIIQLEQIQRTFTHRISGMQDRNYWERLEILGISSLQRRREKIIIINIWKIKNDKIPNSINLKFKDHLRSQKCKAVLPSLPRTNCKLLNKYEHSFIINGAKLWNSLPGTLTHIDNISEFKLCLSRYLQTIPDQPPLPDYNYNRTTYNSLISNC